MMVFYVAKNSIFKLLGKVGKGEQNDTFDFFILGHDTKLFFRFEMPNFELIVHCEIFWRDAGGTITQL